MQFESLANELLLDLFEFFDTARLCRAFLGLNSRFNRLLYHHFRTHQFNFQSLSKEDFDQISERHLSSIIHHIISLRLSNDETPGLPECLLSRGFPLNRFIHLQSLSLYNIPSLDTLNKLISQCRCLPHFTHLHIIKSYEGEVYKNIVVLLNNIWSLPKLIYCNLNGIIHTDETSLSKITSTVSSIEYLAVENIPSNLTTLSNLFKSTPRLQRFSTTLYSYSSNDRLTSVMMTIKRINFFFGGSLTSLKNFLENMPLLSHLTVTTSQVYLDGNIWKELLQTFLPQIEIFQWKMDFDFQQRNEDIDEIVHELLESFRSSFWIEEHQWYVRCHWNPSDPYKSTTLYTLPYAFETYDSSNKCCTKSTCIDERYYWSYDRVQWFGHNHMDHTLFHRFSLLRARFPSIEHLQINLPFDDMFWLRFSSFNHLKSLNVSLYKYSAYCQLQTLFDQASCLYSLKVESFVGLPMQLFRLNSRSIRRLDLIDVLLDQSMYFNRDDCWTLINSSLGMQCEVLFIRISSRTIVLDLIDRMSNLRLLTFECEDDRESFLTFSSSKNELISWLQHQFPSTYSISRDPTKRFRIQIWIHRKAEKLFRADSLSKHRNRFSQVLTSFRQFLKSDKKLNYLESNNTSNE